MGIIRSKPPGVGFCAFDLSHPIVRVASALHAGVQLLFGDAVSLPHASNAFDLVVAVKTFDHIPDAERAIAELRRASYRRVVLNVTGCPIGPS